ncbi:MAG: hypothetical protein LBN93_04085 [Candidatus Symbiothrix sp.]|jgi:hypothetical protein|nr:hypothetical protein [Candidatus Symbiothrix sp.]
MKNIKIENQTIFYLDIVDKNKDTGKYGMTLVYKKGSNQYQQIKKKLKGITLLDGSKSGKHYLEDFFYFQYESDEKPNFKMVNKDNKELTENEIKKIAEIEDAKLYIDVDSNDISITHIKVLRIKKHGKIYEGDDLERFLKIDAINDVNVDLSNFRWSYDDSVIGTFHAYVSVSGISELSLKNLIIFFKNEYPITKLYEYPAYSDDDYLLRLPFADKEKKVKPSRESIEAIINKFKENNTAETEKKIGNLFLLTKIDEISQVLKDQNQKISTLQEALLEQFKSQMHTINKLIDSNTDNIHDDFEPQKSEYEEKLKNYENTIQVLNNYIRGIDKNEKLNCYPPKLLLIGEFMASKKEIERVMCNIYQECCLLTYNISQKYITICKEYNPDKGDIEKFINGKNDYLIEAPHAHSIPIVGEKGFEVYAMDNGIATRIYQSQNMNGKGGMSKNELAKILREIFNDWKNKKSI